MAGLVPAVLLALILPAVYLLVLRLIDRYEPEPWTFLLASVGLGALAAPTLSMALLALLGLPTTLPGELAQGGPEPAIVEQLVKGLLLLVLIHFIRDELDDVVDGVVYGAALGAGFAATQSFLFALTPQRLDAGSTIQLLIAGLNQAFYGAVFGAIVWFAQSQAGRGRYLIVVGLGLATAALLDALHDSLPFVLARILHRPEAVASVMVRALSTGVNLLGLLALAAIVVSAWNRERRIIRAELEDEVGSGVVGPTDVDTLASQRRRLAEQVRAWGAGGLAALGATRRLHTVEAELAFHKWRVRRRSHARANDRRDQLRARIRELRSQLDGLQP